MTLKEFLLTADPDHTVALQQAQEYTETQGRFITSNSLTVYVVQLGLYSVFNDVAATVGHPIRDICMAVIDRLRGVSDFNFIRGTPMGDANFLLLAALKQGLQSKLNELTQLEQLVDVYCNQAVRPFANITLHDVLITREVCPTIPATANGGYVTITTNGDCVKHNPRLMAKNPRTDKWQRINNFYDVSVSGTYDASVPPQFSGLELAVDNPYGVI